MARDLVIDYGGFTMGDTPKYEVHGPTSVGLSFEGIEVSFDIVVVDTPGVDFALAIAAIETALRKRDQSLIITVDGNAWASWLFGQKALNPSCSIDKVGDIDSDTGGSRVYSVTFTAEHAADDLNGLRSINTQVTYVTSNQINVAINGEYTALNGTSARSNYYANIAPIVQAILDLIDATATWENSSRDIGWDRNNHIANWTEQYLQMIFDKTDAGLEHPSIKGHNVVFTRLSAYPGDGAPDTNRPETVVAEYSCIIDTEVVQPTVENLSQIYEDEIKPFLVNTVKNTWSPRSLAIVQNSRAFHGTSSAITGTLTMMMYMPGSDVLEKTENVEFDDSRNIDYTPVWDGSELAAYADQGHLMRLRTTTVTETRFGEHAAEPLLKDGGVRVSGWNKIRGQNGASPVWIGEGEDRTRVTLLTTTLVERFTKRPSGAGGGSRTEFGQDTTEGTPTPAELEERRQEQLTLRRERRTPPGSTYQP